MESAHRAAVVEALRFVEDFAGTTRRGKGGSRIEKSDLVFATFQHSTSRAQDPQLHTHCLLLNISVRSDGTTGAVSSHSVFQAKMAAGSLYRTELAKGLINDLSVPLEKTKDWFEIKGVDTRLIQTFSKRRTEIESLIEADGIASAKGAAVAAIKTRTVKETLCRPELFESWQAEGRSHGWSQAEALTLLGRHEKEPSPARLPSDFRALTESRGFFSEREALRFVLQAAEATGCGASAVTHHVWTILSNPDRVIPLGNDRFTVPARSDSLRSEPTVIETTTVTSNVGRFKARGYTVIGVAADDASAEAFAAAHGIQAYSIDTILQRLEQEKGLLREAFETLKSQKSLGEILGRGGPSILEPIEALVVSPLESWLSKLVPDVSAPARRLLREYGPDIGQAVRYLLSKLPKDELVLDSRTAVVIADPERLPARRLMALMDAIDLVHARPIVALQRDSRSSKVFSEIEDPRAIDHRPEISKGIGPQR